MFSNMEKKKWDVVLLAHILIILWALLFFPSLLLHDGGKIAGALAGGNLAGLFISIPLAVISLIARAKKRFSEKASGAVLVLSILCICVGIAAWTFAVMVILTP